MFTAEQAFEASDDGEPYMIGQMFAEKILREHDIPRDMLDTFWDENADHYEKGYIDAAIVLKWLGY